MEESFNFVDEELSRNDAPPQLVYGKRIKLFADGAAFSLGGQVEPPGYIDGHEGEWITPKDEFRAQAERYWRAGYRVHVHANGDAGIGFTLGVFEDLQEKFPRRPNARRSEASDLRPACAAWAPASRSGNPPNGSPANVRRTRSSSN